MRLAQKQLLIVFCCAGLVFAAHTNHFVYAQEEKAFSLSLRLQSTAKGLVNKLRQSLPFMREDDYRSKYFRLLREFAELKLDEKEERSEQSLELLKEKYPQAVRTKTLKVGEFGRIFIERPKEEVIKDGALVLDENFILVGKVIKARPSSLEVQTLEQPNLEFSVADTERALIGVGKTTGLGFIEVAFVDSKIKALERDALVMTYGQDKIFPANFVFGRLVRLEKHAAFQRAIIEPIANFGDETYFVLP